jgi:hypothetical protein
MKNISRLRVAQVKRRRGEFLYLPDTHRTFVSTKQCYSVLIHSERAAKFVCLEPLPCLHTACSPAVCCDSLRKRLHMLSSPSPYCHVTAIDTCRMPSSGMLGRAALVRTDVSEELNTSTIRVIRIGVLGATLAVTSNRSMLRRNAKSDERTGL